MGRRILFIRLSAIGDVINTLPALAALRDAEPDARIGYVVEDKARDVLRGHPDIDDLFVFPKKRWLTWCRTPGGLLRAVREAREYIRRIRACRWDIALDFQGNLKGALHSLLSGAPRRIGFAPGHTYEFNHLFSTEHVVPPGRRIHRVEKFLSLLDPLGIPRRVPPWRLPEDPGSRSRIEDYLRRTGANGYIILHPGTSGFAVEKRWPPDRYGTLAKRVVDELGLDVLVTWGPGERPIAARVLRESEQRARLSPKTESLLDLAELIRRARLFVSGDTGPMHLAAACGTPCISLFGPKDPAIYRPWGESHTIIQSSTHRMDGISVDQVFDAVRRRLGR